MLGLDLATFLPGFVVGVFLTTAFVYLWTRFRKRSSVNKYASELIGHILDGCSATASTCGRGNTIARLCELDDRGVPVKILGSSNDPYPGIVHASLCKEVQSLFVKAKSDIRRCFHTCDENCDPSGEHREWWVIVPIADAIDRTQVTGVLSLVGRDLPSPENEELVDLTDIVARNACTVSLVVAITSTRGVLSAI